MFNLDSSTIPVQINQLNCMVVINKTRGILARSYHVPSQVCNPVTSRCDSTDVMKPLGSIIVLHDQESSKGSWDESEGNQDEERDTKVSRCFLPSDPK